MADSIIMLSGPVGCGKTTVAPHLVAALPEPVACVEGDAFWSFFAKPKGTPNPRGFRTILGAMTVAAIPFAVAGHRVVIDFTVPTWFLPDAKQLLARRAIPIDFVVLMTDEAVCAERARLRDAGPIADYAQFRAFHAEFAAAGRHVLAMGADDPAKLAARIAAGLERGDFRVD